jgi:hypothetical protein
MRKIQTLRLPCSLSSSLEMQQNSALNLLGNNHISSENTGAANRFKHTSSLEKTSRTNHLTQFQISIRQYAHVCPAQLELDLCIHD